jgi:putative ABC transport system ATP-binding protein
MSFLEIRNASKSYGEGSTLVHALIDASLSVDRGHLIAVMGPSGSGKSSLLTIAGSLEEPTKGEVLIDGKSLASTSYNDKARLRRRTIGYIFQDFNLLAGLTALENVALPLELDDLSPRKARIAAMTALESVGIAERAGHFPDELSGGERQRVAIARAVVGERQLLLADEPSGALDSANGDAVIEMIRGACQQGVAAVIVTHDAHLASRADRVVILKDGRIIDQSVATPSPEVVLAPVPIS